MTAEKIVFPAPELRAARPQMAWSPTQLHELLSRHVGAPTAVISRDLHFIHVNAIFAKWFGLVPEQLVGVPIRDVYGEHNSSRFMPYLERAFAGEELRYQRQVRNPNGAEEWHTVCMSPCRNEVGEVIAVVSAALDVHELRVTTEALRTANQRLSSHMENSPLAVIEIDHLSRIIYCSARSGELFGWSPAAVQGQSLPTLLAFEGSSDSPLNLALGRLQRREEARNRAEAAHPRADGSTLHCDWFNSAQTNAQGELVSIMALVHDVTERVETARQMRYLVERDSLTGLYNRSALIERLERGLDRARASGSTVALLFIDLDGFKNVNDRFGHGAGDDVLREVSQRLVATVRERDTVARLGGDEFAVLLDTDVDADTAEALCRRILNALVPTFGVAAVQMPIGASIGVATSPPLEGHAEGLVKRADQAMYDAKRAGKGCVRYALLV